jgi:hypothetical protein
MNTNGANSERESGTTPPSEWPADEAEVIRREAEQARAALRESLEQLQSSLKTAADVRLWTQHHPWVSVGVAAVAGFAVAHTLFSGADGAGAGQVAEGASAGRPSRAPETGSPQAPRPRPTRQNMLMSLLKDGAAMLATAAIRAGTEAYAAHADASQRGAAQPSETHPTSPPSAV